MAGSEVIQIFRESNTDAQVSSKPFKLTGNYNRKFKRLFNLSSYEENGPDCLSGALTERIHSQQTRATIADTQRRPLPPPTHARSVDLNGAPLSIHRGLTSIRARSTKQGAVGTCVPAANQRLSLVRDFEWLPSPYISPSTVSARRSSLSFSAPSSSASSSPFRLPGVCGGLFDPAVRSHARNDTHDPDAQLLQWLTPGRANHARPFLATSTARGVCDYSFVSGHRQFPYKYSPFELTEPTMVTMAIPALATGEGFRQYREEDDGNGRIIGSLRKAFRPAGGITGRHACETDRNSNMHSVQSLDEMCAHHCKQLDREKEILVKKTISKAQGAA